jgi:hypothetical protein
VQDPELDIFKKNNRNIKIRRFVSENEMFKTRIKINCVDNISKKISAELVASSDLSKKSDRFSFIVCSSIFLSIKEQKLIVDSFNKTIVNIREKYGSLVFPYYLGFGRKRIPFN